MDCFGQMDLLGGGWHGQLPYAEALKWHGGVHLLKATKLAKSDFPLKSSLRLLPEQLPLLAYHVCGDSLASQCPKASRFRGHGDCFSGPDEQVRLRCLSDGLLLLGLVFDHVRKPRGEA